MGQATVPVADFYAHCRPLLEETLAPTSRLAAEGDLEAVYVTGGGSELPLVARVLREEFGRKAKRSEYTRSATAIGLAIQADATSGYALREMFTRNFGVWRESDAGSAWCSIRFFRARRGFPARANLRCACDGRYRPVHNVGDFRVSGSQPGGRRRAAFRRHGGVGRDSVSVRSRAGRRARPRRPSREPLGPRGHPADRGTVLLRRRRAW